MRTAVKFVATAFADVLSPVSTLSAPIWYWPLRPVSRVPASTGTDGGSVHNVFGRVPTYTLIRRQGASYTAVTVDETFKLEQGDILRVDFPAPQSSDSSGIQREAAR